MMATPEEDKIERWLSEYEGPIPEDPDAGMPPGHEEVMHVRPPELQTPAPDHDEPPSLLGATFEHGSVKGKVVAVTPGDDGALLIAVETESGQRWEFAGCYPVAHRPGHMAGVEVQELELQVERFELPARKWERLS